MCVTNAKIYAAGCNAIVSIFEYPAQFRDHRTNRDYAVAPAMRGIIGDYELSARR